MFMKQSYPEKIANEKIRRFNSWKKEKESSKKTYILTNGSSFQYPNCIDRGPVMAILAQ